MTEVKQRKANNKDKSILRWFFENNSELIYL